MRDTNYSRSILICCLLGVAVLAVVLGYRAVDVRAARPSSSMAAPRSSEPLARLGVVGHASASTAGANQGVVVVSSSYFPAGSFLYLVGEVRNDASTNVNAVVVTATYLDSVANVLGSSSANSEHQVLIPGQISPFLIFDAYPTGLVTYTLAVTASLTSAVPVGPLSVLGVRDLTIAGGGLALVGELQNTQPVTVTNAKVIVTLYDALGKVINAQSAYVYNSLLIPGQKSPFSVVFDAGPTSYGARAIGTDTRQSNAIPPDLHSIHAAHHVDGQGALHWTGQVENRGHTEARLVKAMVTLYDDAGGVVNVGASFTSPSTIGPGEAADFDIVVAGDLTGWTSYALYPPEDGTPTTTPTPTATRTPTATATVGPPGDLWMTGHVYDAAVGPTPGISGAVVSVLVCVPHAPFSTHSGVDGYYELLLPAGYLNQCANVTLLAGAAGYHSFEQTVTVAELRAQPQRDFALVVLPTATPTSTPGPRLYLYLPLVLRNHTRR
jgi:hypothetical protein